MERIYVLTLIHTVIPIVSIGIILGLLIMLLARRNQRKVKENTEKKVNIQKVFSSLSTGSSLLLVKDRLGACKSVSSANLVSEVILENGVNRKTYVWYLDWDYVISKSSGVGMMPIHTSTFNTGGNGMSFTNGTATSFSSGKTTQKAFIQMVFENDKLIAKEQQGLYQ